MPVHLMASEFWRLWVTVCAGQGQKVHELFFQDCSGGVSGALGVLNFCCCTFASVMQTTTLSRSSRPVAIWIMAGVFMLMIQVLLGGITRLTGSGLSITEWDVVTGTLPPLTHAHWMVLFQKYQQTPQYRLLNDDFTLSNFKFIFFWEWFHRLWARTIGLVFLIPFIIFLVQRRFREDMIRPLVILFLLGALQGAIGWIMVASGLTGDAVYVKPTKLAMHFVFAMGLICYAFWFGLELLVPKGERSSQPGLQRFTLLLLVILFLQLTYGAFMAGHKAATAAATWPTINGQWVPDGLCRFSPMGLNFVENKIMIHFIHRGLAYVLAALVIWLTVRCKRVVGGAGFLFARTYRIPLVLVLVQVVLGIVAVLTSPQIIPGHWGIFEWVAQLHQLVAMFLMLSLVYVLYLVKGRGPAM